MQGRVAVLLRGVNVGGRKVEMARLRQELTAMGFGDVETYLQSGNAVVTLVESVDRQSLVAQVQTRLSAELGFDCRVIVRDAAQLAACVADDPLLALVDAPANHLVGFLSDRPEAGRAEALLSRDYGDDQISIRDDHVYMWCPNGVSRSPFFKMKLDRDLGVEITTRNWNTVLKLAELTARNSPRHF
jgi:uncharacterized protein (DUF1697 family)